MYEKRNLCPVPHGEEIGKKKESHRQNCRCTELASMSQKMQKDKTEDHQIVSSVFIEKSRLLSVSHQASLSGSQ